MMMDLEQFNGYRWVCCFGVAIGMLVTVLAQAADHTFDLRFSKRRIATTVERAVVRGDRDFYRFEAKGGQRVSIAMSSFEDNG